VMLSARRAISAVCAVAAAGALSAVTAVVPGRTRPLGLLCVVGKTPRRFPDDATGFLKALAHVLGVAMERDRAERELETERARLEELVLERTAELEASHEKVRQAERLRAIATLASGITHEMNNVMLPALCKLDAIEAGGLPASAEREVEGVRGAQARVAEIDRDAAKVLAQAEVLVASGGIEEALDALEKVAAKYPGTLSAVAAEKDAKDLKSRPEVARILIESMRAR